MIRVISECFVATQQTFCVFVYIFMALSLLLLLDLDGAYGGGGMTEAIILRHFFFSVRTIVRREACNWQL